MKLRHLVPILIMMLASLTFASACAIQRPMKVSQLLGNPVYDTKVEIYGEVSLLGELFCPCFELTSGGKKVLVWYGLMVEDDGTERSPVSVEGIENGDRIIVTGELKKVGNHSSFNDFWAIDIRSIE